MGLYSVVSIPGFTAPKGLDGPGKMFATIVRAACDGTLGADERGHVLRCITEGAVAGRNLAIDAC
jgi:hypothetical protein